MKTHNRFIYHCQVCGSIKTCEPHEKGPSCCGARMVKAAAETVVDQDEPAAEAEPRIQAGANVPGNNPAR